MANARIARFVMEVAPPQFISVMRHRTAKMLDTISEEEKDISGSGSDCLPSKSFSSASASCCSMASASSPSASASAVAASDSKYFLRGVQVQRSFSIFEN
ncbi:Galactosyltransferase family protein [Melia azedarach]|uniref:Galactosyltransferase family protein n=1 Tax=Melia azedarach TaxID=155640 RepID=A0ACC1WWJ7_MELAZ|nr:Galactosyltransferase family protein [Melia azedarach]